MSQPEFTIRVYGLLINEKNEILLSDEQMFQKRFTKFPGGGLEQGEGTIDCLRRECLEEMNQPIRNIKHFYTTDFYQASYFHSGKQLLSIYYTFQLDGKQQFEVVDQPFGITADQKGDFEVFRWVSLNKIVRTDLTFPIDQYVIDLVKHTI